jgi:hypothetical protein
MSKDHLDFDYASHHLILSSKFLKKLTVIRIDPQIQIVKKNKKEREKHSLKYNPLINSSIYALTKSVRCGTFLFSLSFSSADRYPRA